MPGASYAGMWVHIGIGAPVIAAIAIGVGTIMRLDISAVAAVVATDVNICESPACVHQQLRYKTIVIASG